MPEQQEPQITRSLDDVIAEVGLYAREAYEFVHRGLNETVIKVHADQTDPTASRHVTGQQLCEGLRGFALQQWGMLARMVLARWGITRTEDFGRIIFAFVENGFMQKQDDDTQDDFKDVYDFAAAFDGAYPIGMKS